MADENFFSQFDELAPEPTGQPGGNFFAQFDEEPKTSDPFGAGIRAVQRAMVPAAASLIEAGIGAKVGAELASGFGPGGRFLGGLAGGLAGGIHGAYAAATAQDFGLSMLPDDWVDAIGQDEDQRALDQTLHPVETFIGGNIPYLLTMKPGGFKAPKLAPNATTYERIATNPITGRIFGGAVNGGMELGMEMAQGEVDWRNVAIATGFGMVFNAPNRIGAKLASIGEDIALKTGVSTAAMMAAEKLRSSRRSQPTVAMAGDAKVMGPGITEEVFMGTQAMSPEAEMSVQEAVRAESAILAPKATVADVRQTARQMEPDLFSTYDALIEQRGALAGHPQAVTVEAQIREIEPQLQAAMRRAADYTGAEVIEPDLPPVAPETAAVAEPGAPVAPEAQPIDAQVMAIADIVARDMIAAGRPESEARAAGALLGRRYATRAQRLGRTDPLALYNSEGAVLRGAQPRGTPAKPPLIPTPEQPNLVPAPATPEARQNAPSEIESIDPAEIGVDAERFQFKSGGDEQGVTERLQGVEQWDARLAGTALIYRDAEGKNWVADGHQRVGLAKRLSETQPGIRINAFVLNAADGYTDASARAIAAITNIAQGTGSATDAAKVLRVAKETGVELPPLPPRSALVRDGRALAELSPEAFGIIVNEVVPAQQGAIVGRMVKDPAQQMEALRLFAAVKPENVQQAEMIVRDMLSTGTIEGRMESLFGAEDYAGSIVLERAKIADEAMKQLRRDKTTFKTLVDEAERIQGAGANVLDQQSNQSRLSTDEQAAEFLKSLAFRAGPVSDALSDVARKLKSGEIKTAEAARTFLGDVRRAVEAGVVTGDSAGGAEPGPSGERPLDEGPELFQPAPPIDTPEFNAWFGSSKIVDASGAPLVLYHGSTKDFDAFDPRKATDHKTRGKGVMFFTTKPEVASSYAGVFDVQGEAAPRVSEGGNVTPVYLKAENPAVWDVFGGEFTSEFVTKAIKEAKRDGHDSIVFRNMRDEPTYMGSGTPRASHVVAVFEPTQIKSQFNRGTFDPSDPRILYQNKPPLWKEGDMLGEFNTERGLEGLPQAVIPGAEVTDKDRLKLAMSKPLTGDNAPPPKGGLFDEAGRQDEANQLTLFQSAKRAGLRVIEYENGKENARTDAIRALDAEQGEDSRTLFQQKRGAIQLADGQRPLITLFEKADASTFLHETAHQWFEELLRDAKTEGVSDVVKVDEGTVRKWLGMGEDQSRPTTKQHEKFARGFEQYLREGTAPSAALGRVFAQFKSWLMDIYRSIKGLGAPINEDIRAVFDRMIELEPQRTVVAPEAEAAGGGMARTHENDAETIEPGDAEPAFDRVIAERDRSILDLPPEVQNELTAALAADAAVAGGETGDGAGGSAEMVEGGIQPEPLAPGGSSSSQPGSVVGGSGQTGGEGIGAPVNPVADAGLRNERPGAAGPARANPLAPLATDLFPATVSPFTDKAGNIRLENLTSDEDVRQAIRDAAGENEDFIGDRRGVITDGQVMDLADALGMDAEMLDQRKVGQSFNAEQIIAARKLLIESATNVSALAKRVAMNTSTDQDLLAYAQARAKHRMIQGHIAGITAEAGRALRAFRNISGEMDQARTLDQLMRDTSARTLFQMKEEAKLAAMLDTPQKLSRFMNDAEKPGFMRMVQEYWINALVSGPRTHVTNIVSNTLFSLQKMGPETLATAGIGAVRSAMGRKGERVRFGEALEQFKRAGRALPVGIQAAIDSMRAGKGVELPSEPMQGALQLQPGSELAEAPKLNEDATWADIAPSLFGLMRGLGDGMLSIGKLVASGGDPNAPLVGLKRSPLGSIPDVQVRGTTVLPVGTMARIPTRFLAASDSFFRAVAFSAEKGTLAYRRATEEGLTGAARDARISALYQNPDAQMMEQASDVAAELAFMSRESQFVKAFSRFANTPILGVPIVKFVSPFINTPANIIEQTIVHRTPVGLFSPEIRADLMGKNGNVAQDTALAKMMVGSAYAIGFGLIAAQGFLNGSGPEDDNEKALWRLTGNQPNSVRVGDVWYDIRALGPLGLLASMSADLYDLSETATEEGLTAAGSQLLNAFMQNILNASFMTGPADLIQAVEDPDRYGNSYVQKFISSFVPSVLAQPAQAMDPYMRQARNVVDSMKRRVPGLSQSLLPRIDIWGRPVETGGALGINGVSPIYTDQMTRDPVNLTLGELGYWPGYVSRKIRGVELTDNQYNEYAALAGRMTKQRLDVIITSPQFRQWPAQAKHDIIAETIRQSREVARGMMLGRYPQIAAEAVRMKLSPLGED